MKKLFEKLFGLILAITILFGAGNIPRLNPLPSDNDGITINSANDDNHAGIETKIDDPDQEISQ